MSLFRRLTSPVDTETIKLYDRMSTHVTRGIQIAGIQSNGFMEFKTANFDNPQSQNPASAERRPRRRSDLTCRTIDGATVILNREDGVLHQLNPTASFIWNCCDGTVGVRQIVDRLTNAYEIDPRTCRKDVDEVLIKLQTLNLLT